MEPYHPTVRELATTIASSGLGGLPAATLSHWKSKLDGLPDDDIVVVIEHLATFGRELRSAIPDSSNAPIISQLEELLVVLIKRIRSVPSTAASAPDSLRAAAERFGSIAGLTPSGTDQEGMSVLDLVLRK